MNILTVILVSRCDYLDDVIQSIDYQTHPVKDILVITDGVDSSVVARSTNKLNARIRYVQNRSSQAIDRSDAHQANSHNLARKYVQDYDLVWSVEDDGILPPDALERLIHTYSRTGADIVTGVQINRHIRRAVGAWAVNNIDDPTIVATFSNEYPSDSIREIDGSGMYCSLVRREVYEHHVFKPDPLGVDFDFCISVRRDGGKIYIDWSVGVVHLTSDGKIYPQSHNDIIIFIFIDGGWKRL